MRFTKNWTQNQVFSKMLVDSKPSRWRKPLLVGWMSEEKKRETEWVKKRKEKQKEGEKHYTVTGPVISLSLSLPLSLVEVSSANV